MRIGKVEDRRPSQSRHGPVDLSVVLKFGGGLHTEASEEEIDEREAADGQNFDLRLKNRQFRNRKPFDLIGTVPNESEIRGMACLIKSDGTVSVLVQAGDTVYEWDGATTFTSKGTVASTAKLRGRLEHNWQLSDKVIITDINLAQPVMEWDGTTLQNVSFTDQAASAFGVFRAKYCQVTGERALFANIHDNGSNFPNLLIGSELGDFTVITTDDRPSSAIGDDAPFFLAQPDNRAINGMAQVYGVTVLSSQKGSMFKLTGSTSKDFAMTEFYPQSGASGSESVVYVGNDVVYGRDGRIESLVSTETFGDVSTDDLSIFVANEVETYDEWLNVYNQRLQRVYCHPVGNGEFWVLHKPLVQSGLSPWSKWVTSHTMNLNPTCMMNMFDPSDGLEYVFMGDESGNFYRLEGTGESGDGGTTEIKTERLSHLFKIPVDAEAYDISGYILYRKIENATVTLTFEYAGLNAFNETITIEIEAPPRSVYSGSVYYGGGVYYGRSPFDSRLTRKLFGVPGRSTEFQVRVSVTGNLDVEINEIGLKFEAAS